MVLTIRVFAENLVGLGFLESVSYIEPIPTHENLFAVGKSGPTATFNLIFLGLGWPWVGEFVDFIIIFICFPTQQSFVNRKHLRTAYQCWIKHDQRTSGTGVPADYHSLL